MAKSRKRKKHYENLVKRAKKNECDMRRLRNEQEESLKDQLKGFEDYIDETDLDVDFIKKALKD